MAKSKADLLREIYSDDFMEGYLECLGFTEEESLPERWAEDYGDEDTELDDAPSISFDKFDVASLKKIIKDCKGFMAKCEKAGLDLEAWGETQAGHDFWLTRNDHGAGFWDRGRKDGDALSKIAKSFGEVYVSMGKTGSLYHS